MPFKIVAFGEILWDLLPEGRTLGGAPFNFAYRVNSLGDTAFPISRLGRDALGREACNLVTSFGIDPSCLQWDDSFPTGTVQVSFDACNNPDFVIVPSVAYDFIESTLPLEQIVQSADCLCFGTLIQRSEVSRNTLYRLLRNAAFCRKLLDVNLRKNCFTPETVRRSIEAADIVKLNEKEAFAVGEMLGLPALALPRLVSEMAKRSGLEAVVVTLGDKGVLAASRGGEQLIYVPGFRVAVVDSVGSGDAFSAGFIHRLLRAATLEEACAFGNLMGAATATKRGGTAPISRDEITRLGEQSHVERIVDPELEKFWRGWAQ
ncbi:MAG: carbohydrate kinase [Acidobacteriota bacterium]